MGARWAPALRRVSMRKILVSTTLIALYTSVSYAQSSVTLSGSIYSGIGLNSGRVGNPSNDVTKTALGGSSSFMLSGREELIKGNYVIFKLENGFNADTGALANSSTIFDKQAFVGFQGNWGTLRAGRIYTPSFATLALVADPTGTFGVGTSTNIMESHGVRMNNGVIYNSPGFNPWTYARKGLFGAVAHFFGESTEGSSKNSATGLNLGFGRGNLIVELSHHWSNSFNTPQNEIKNSNTIFAMNYKLDKSKIFFAFSDNNAKNLFLNIKTKDNQDYLIGLTYQLPVGKLMASYIYKNDKMYFNNDASQISVLYDYPLSKRTKLSFGFAKIKNKNNATYKVANGYAGTVAANAGTQSITIGMTHRF